MRNIYRKSLFIFGLCLFFSLLYSWVYFQGQYPILGPAASVCELTTLDPWDASMIRFMTDLPLLPCSVRKQIMFVNQSGYIVFNQTLMQSYNIHEKSFTCTYSNLERLEGDFDVKFENPIPFEVPEFIQCHMFRVKCSDKTGKIFYDYLHFNTRWNKDAKAEADIEDESEDKPSLIILGMDSVSRSHAVRSIPSTYKYLQNVYQMTEFKGYTKVGDNTEPNLLALLSGSSFKNFRFHHLFKSYSDDWSWVWKHAAMSNIATLFAEDSPDIPMFKKRLKHAPTDYYYRPFTLGMNQFIPKIIDELKQTSHRCYGVNEQLDLQVDYLKGFLTNYATKRKFAMLWINAMSHDSFTGLRDHEATLLQLLKWMKHAKLLENSIFMIVSDHGLRGSDASMTYVGRAESHKPWLMLHVPDKLKGKYKWLNRTLALNSERLVSPFDVYLTMTDLFSGSAFIERPVKSVQQTLQARNLFNEIPKNRPCADAGLEGEWCICDKRSNISVKSEVVSNISKFVVLKINDLLTDFQDVCHVLSLVKILDASVIYSKIDYNYVFKDVRRSNSSVLTKMYRYVSLFISAESHGGRYTVVFSTSPGQAVFEATVDVWNHGRGWSKKNMSLVGDPVRLNRYGDTSHCVPKYMLKPYCFCRDQTVVS